MRSPGHALNTMSSNARRSWDLETSSLKGIFLPQYPKSNASILQFYFCKSLILPQSKENNLIFILSQYEPNHKETLQSFPGSVIGQLCPDAGNGNYFILSAHKKTHFSSFPKASTFFANTVRFLFGWLVFFCCAFGSRGMDS